jgi:hypothetical protein
LLVGIRKLVGVRKLLVGLRKIAGRDLPTPSNPEDRKMNLALRELRIGGQSDNQCWKKQKNDE